MGARSRTSGGVYDGGWHVLAQGAQAPVKFGARGWEVSKTGFAPTNLANLATWYRSDLGITLNAGGVSAWADQSGNAQNLFQATAAKQPVYNASDSGYNNHPTLSFAKANSQVLLATIAWTLNQPSTVFVVGQSDQSSQQGFTDFETGTEMADYTAGANQVDIFANGGFGFNAANLNAASIIGGIFNGASSSVFLNSKTAAATGAVGVGASGTGGMIVGGLQGPSNFLNGKVAEVIAYSRALTAAELALLVNTYLGPRYGIATT